MGGKALEVGLICSPPYWNKVNLVFAKTWWAAVPHIPICTGGPALTMASLLGDEKMLMQHHRYAHKYKGITFRQHTYTGKIQMALA